MAEVDQLLPDCVPLDVAGIYKVWNTKYEYYDFEKLLYAKTAYFNYSVLIQLMRMVQRNTTVTGNN